MKAMTLLTGCQEEHLACKKLTDKALASCGMVICLQQGANNLHVVQLTPRPPHYLLRH